MHLSLTTIENFDLITNTVKYLQIMFKTCVYMYFDIHKNNDLHFRSTRLRIVSCLPQFFITVSILSTMLSI